MNQKPVYSTHIGAASILLIFMVLSLISFAALTLVNSRADYILSKKLLDRTSAYYSACHEANAYVAETENKLKGLRQESNNKTDFIQKAGDLTLSKSFPISETQYLEVEIAPEFPTTPGESPYSILKWQVITDDENITLDETLPVIK